MLDAAVPFDPVEDAAYHVDAEKSSKVSSV